MNQVDIRHHTVGTTGILIDGFKFKRPTCTAYFLTHYHSDHYSGLDEHFPWDNTAGARLYCTPVTAALAMHSLDVPRCHITQIPFNVPTRVLDFTVTMLSANHCPGAAMLLFELADGRHILHTGDMRYHPSMLSNPHLQRCAGITPQFAATATGGTARQATAGGGTAVSGFKRRAVASTRIGTGVDGGSGDGRAAVGLIDELYLDTTYGHPRHVFAPQADSIDEIVSLVRQYIREDGALTGAPLAPPPTDLSGLGTPESALAGDTAEHAFTEAPAPVARTDGVLLLVSTYVIGKERILLALGRRLGLKIYVSMRKYLLLQNLGLDDADLAVFTTRRADADVHVVGMDLCGRNPGYFQPGWDSMGRYMGAVNAFLKQQRAQEAAAAVSLSTASFAPRYVAPSGSAPPVLSVTAVGDEEDEEAFVSGVRAQEDREDTLRLTATGASGGNHDGARAVASALASGEGGGADSANTGAGDVTLPAHTAGVTDTRTLAPPLPQTYSRVVGIIPTGWVHSNKKKRYVNAEGSAEVHLVPYSEHSAYNELVEFVTFLRPRKVIPTVYSDSRDQDKIVARFSSLVNHTAAKKAFLQKFGPASASATSDRTDHAYGVAPQPEGQVFGVEDDEGTEVLAVPSRGCDAPSGGMVGRLHACQCASSVGATADVHVSEESDDEVVYMSCQPTPKRLKYTPPAPPSATATLQPWMCYACNKKFEAVGGTRTCPACGSDFVECVATATTNGSPAQNGTGARAGVAVSPSPRHSTASASGSRASAGRKPSTSSDIATFFHKT